MVIKFFSFLMTTILFNSCVYPSYKFEKNNDGEPILDSDSYTFNEKLTVENFTEIDTSSYYIETFQGLDSNDGQRANPSIYKFHADGYFKKTSYMYFEKFDKERNKKSAYYGGKYKLNKNIIFMESFYPISGNKSNRYSKVISKGIVRNDTIYIDFFGTPYKFVKKNYNQIFK
jgi:hypothetical protein